MSRSSNDNTHVLIIGAGLGALTFAQTLRKQNVSFSIFERDPSPINRAQGWGIGVSWILEPLLSSIPLDDKPPIESCTINASLGLEKADESDGSCFMNGHTGVVIQKNLKKFQDVRELRVNRKNLRNWLLLGVPVQWGKKFVRYEEDADGVTAYFEDGTNTRGTILVGADGVNSQGELILSTFQFTGTDSITNSSSAAVLPFPSRSEPVCPSVPNPRMPSSLDIRPISRSIQARAGRGFSPWRQLPPFCLTKPRRRPSNYRRRVPVVFVVKGPRGS